MISPISNIKSKYLDPVEKKIGVETKEKLMNTTDNQVY